LARSKDAEVLHSSDKRDQRFGVSPTSTKWPDRPNHAQRYGVHRE